MLDTMTVPVDSEHLVLLDEQALATVSGGEGIKDWLAKQIGGLLFDCIGDSLDTIISAAQEGYEDAR
jgi:hypothetical protein